MAPKSPRDLASSLEQLKIKPVQDEPADSWEDEADDDSPVTPKRMAPSKGLSSPGLPGPPPPTPSSPSYSAGKTQLGNPYQTFPPHGFDGVSAERDDDEAPATRAGEERRPEKSTAVASRLIAAGIGQKAPRRTKEQREYDQAMKVQEKKKRDQAKADEERKKAEKARAMQAIWDD